MMQTFRYDGVALNCTIVEVWKPDRQTDRQTEKQTELQGSSYLSPPNFWLAAYLRLGLPLPLCDNIQTCDCGRASDDSSGYRQITCKTGSGPVWSHDLIMSVWSECLNNLKIQHTQKRQKIDMLHLTATQTLLLLILVLVPT